MNIFYKVTLQSLRRNKVRTVVTIIGIMLSAAMICAVTTSISSLRNYMLQNAIYEAGDWHGSVVNGDWELYEQLQSCAEVSRIVYDQQLGYAPVEGSKNEYKPYLYVLGMGKGFESAMPIHLTSGRYPSNSGEILLPNHLAENGGVSHKIGDVLTLTLGNRMLGGEVLGQRDPFYASAADSGEEVPEGEILEIRETRSYTVTGFYDRPGFEDYSAPGYTAITVADAHPSAWMDYDIYFKIKNPKQIYTFMEEQGIKGNTNSRVLMFSGVSRYSTFDSVLTGLAFIVMLLIMFGSVSLIYNAFSISVSERTRQFGLLSSVGATRKQLRYTVFFEAFAVSLIGIPLGILVGIGGIGVTLLLIGNRFTALGSFPIPMRICVSPAAILIASAVALVTVLISVWIPSRRATKVSAVEAIRQNLDVKSGNKPVRTSKLTYKLFGLPGVLANKHYKRSRKKYRATIASLFMSIVLFVSASALTDYLTESVSGSFATNGFDLSFSCKESDFTQFSKDELLNRMKNCKGVQEAVYTQIYSLDGEISRSCLSPEMSAQLSSSDAPESGTVPIWVMIYFVHDGEFRKLLKDWNLNEQIYMNPEAPLAVALDGMTLFDENEEKYVQLNLLRGGESEVTVYDASDNEAQQEYTLKSGTTIYTRPYFTATTSSLVLLYPESLVQTVIPERQPEQSIYYYFLTTENHSISYAALRQLLNENGFRSANLYDYADYAEQNRNIVTIIKVFAYGFIVLISLIAAANVFNTISTNIYLRRREFAMLKSVGMTERGFNRMMNFECLLYGTRALIWGLPVSVIFTWFVYQVVTQGYSVGFRLPWKAMGIAVLSVFAVVFVTMMYAMRKIKKDNPIDALKNENL